jgi:hypothetical protein
MIIEHVKTDQLKAAFLNIYPDQFKSESEKQKPEYIKNTMDYFQNVAYAQYMRNRRTFVANYDLVKGILRPEDFYEEPEVKSFMDTLMEDQGLPSFVKHYSILSPPLNTLVGEMIKRPDIYKVKAFDDESKSEELQFKTQIYQDFVLNEVKRNILALEAQKGNVDIAPEDVEEMTLEKVQEYMVDYTSMAERWGNHVLEALKVEFNMKEKSEEMFRDLLITSREFLYVYEDNSKLGFNVRVANPQNVWKLTTENKKYIKESYACGLVEVMEISQIIDEIPEITKEEIDHLRKGLEDYGLLNISESNYGRAVQPGIGSIKYDTYDPLVLKERMLAESEMKGGSNEVGDFLGASNEVSAFGYKYVVTTAYWQSKMLVKLVTYLDENNDPQSFLADENYVEGSIPTEISVEEGWVNQLYQGRKIGPDIYHVKPFKMLDYMPIIGVIHEAKNTDGKSFIDMIKPFQTLVNVLLNQAFDILKKDKGKALLQSLRHIPLPKDGDAQDAIGQWLTDLENEGIIFVDDSPENLKVPSAFNQFKEIDLSRINEASERVIMASNLRREAWLLVGITEARQGSVAATATATATNTELTQSYAQTEPYFAQHEYVMDQGYQAIVDAAQYVQATKPTSSLSYITNEGEAAFIEVTGPDIKGRDLKVFVASRPDDQRIFNEIRSLAQPMLQNGGDIYDVISLYSTNSVRQMKRTFKVLKDMRMQAEQQRLANEQKQLQLQEQEIQANIEAAAADKEKDRAHENYNKAEDRLNKKEVALINALGRNAGATADIDNDGVADALEITRQQDEQALARAERDIKLQELAQKRTEGQGELLAELQKVQLEREKMKHEKEMQDKDMQKEKIKAKAATQKAKQAAKKKPTKK